MQRTAAVDYGRRRIGLAVADPLGISVRGLATLEKVLDPADGARRAAAAFAAEEVGRILVGLPLYASGDESPMAVEARAFGALLAEAAGLPVGFVDETLTTWEAEEAVRARGIPLREAKQSGLLDQQAAVAILRGWLREGLEWPCDGIQPDV
ncbi:MAG: Holliday junction resolvase RuvX [Planctomycetota bacterium]|nr:Holliday junction resolvase RuvX [Planctomycetota bacterium]